MDALVLNNSIEVKTVPGVSNDRGDLFKYLLRKLLRGTLWETPSVGSCGPSDILVLGLCSPGLYMNVGDRRCLTRTSVGVRVEASITRWQLQQLRGGGVYS